MSDSSGPKPKLRLFLVGWRTIATRVAELLRQRAAPVEIVGVAVRDRDGAEDPPEGAALLTGPAGLAGLEPDLVVEAASREAVAPWGRAALAANADFAVSSTAAFADNALLAELLVLAEQGRGRLIIPPGALGGIDALAAAGRLPLETVRHEIVKPPAAWKGTPAEAACDLDRLAAAVTFFEGPARQAADAFPQNANVAVISALAGIGLERTTVALLADPAATMNRHTIIASGDFGRFQITLENRPLATNPKSSEMTALSLVRLIENRAGSLVL